MLECAGEVFRQRAVLERIVALLLALAGLADRAAGLPAVQWGRVFAALLHGEAVARDHIVGLAHDLGAPSGGDASCQVPAAGGVAALAGRLRALALLLGALLVLARRYAGRRSVPGRPDGAAPGHGMPCGMMEARRQVAAPDTS